MYVFNLRDRLMTCGRGGKLAGKAGVSSRIIMTRSSGRSPRSGKALWRSLGKPGPWFNRLGVAPRTDLFPFTDAGLLTAFSLGGPRRGNRRSGGDCNDWLTSQSTRRNPPLADLASANRGGTLGASWLDEIRAHRLPKRSTAHMWPAVRAASRTRSRLASGQYPWLAGRSMGRTHPARTGAA